VSRELPQPSIFDHDSQLTTHIFIRDGVPQEPVNSGRALGRGPGQFFPALLPAAKRSSVL